MYELVIEISGVEKAVRVKENELEAKLALERHIRSLAKGEASVRKVAKKK